MEPGVSSQFTPFTDLEDMEDTVTTEDDAVEPAPTAVPTEEPMLGLQPLRFIGNLFDPEFRHARMFLGADASEMFTDDAHSRRMADDDYDRLTFRHALTMGQWATPAALGLLRASADLEAQLRRDLDTFADWDAAWDAQQLQNAIDASMAPEYTDAFVPDPADSADVAALPIVRLDAAEGACVICLDTLAAGDECLDFPCHHVMHAACSRRWFEAARTCPTCKRELFPAA